MTFKTYINNVCLEMLLEKLFNYNSSIKYQDYYYNTVQVNTVLYNTVLCRHSLIYYNDSHGYNGCKVCYNRAALSPRKLQGKLYVALIDAIQVFNNIITKGTNVW